MQKPWFRETELFTGGAGGYHTYRIPALIVTSRGTVLALCEGRIYSQFDHGKIDIVIRRSRDGGTTWSDTQVIHSDGDHTIGNPCIVQDRTTGKIWLLFCKDNDRVFATSSDDDGVTWAEPRDITVDVKPENWTWYATGPRTRHPAIERASRRPVRPQRRDAASLAVLLLPHDIQRRPRRDVEIGRQYVRFYR